MIDAKTLDRLAAIDEKSWGRIYKELVRYANFKLDKAGFQIRTEKDSVDAEHFAALAIEKVFEGVRAWDYERYPDITIHLIGVVKSLMSSHFKSSSRSIIKAGGKADEETVTASDEANDDDLLDDDSRTIEGTDEILMTAEIWQEVALAFGDKKDDHAIFCEWLDNSPPRDIADAWDIPVTEVNNAIKRGIRIVRTFYNKKQP